MFYSQAKSDSVVCVISCWKSSYIYNRYVRVYIHKTGFWPVHNWYDWVLSIREKGDSISLGLRAYWPVY